MLIHNSTFTGDKVFNSFFKEFEIIKERSNGKIIIRDHLINGKISFLTNHLLSKGAVSKTNFSNIINLNHDIKTLKQNVRKSYKSLINWGKRELNLKIFNYSNASKKEIEIFRELHFHVSNRRTRSYNSWIKQFESIKNNEAFMIFGYKNQTVITAGLFLLNDKHCYYGVSASMRVFW